MNTDFGFPVEPTVSTSPSSPLSSAPATAASVSPVKVMLVGLGRLLLLGVGCGVAGSLGVAIALVFPSPHPERPWVDHGFRRVQRVIHRLESLNGVWIQPPPLTPQAELAQLQQDLQRLSDRTAALERQLAPTISPATTSTPLELRLQTLAQAIATQPAPPISTLSAPLKDRTQAETASDPLTVTLPSDILFESGETTFRPEALRILDSIVTDLRAYPQRTIRIAAHSDNAEPPQDRQSLTFRQARAVQQYLAQTLGSDYRWLIVGYGDTRPLATNDTEAHRLRNRRLEIVVAPRS